VSADFGRPLKPRADKALRKSGEVTNTLKGRPSRAVMQDSVASRLRSHSVMTYLFIGPATAAARRRPKTLAGRPTVFAVVLVVAVVPGQVNVSQPLPSSSLHFSTLMSCFVWRCVCRPLVEPPPVLMLALHSLQHAD